MKIQQQFGSLCHLEHNQIIKGTGIMTPSPGFSSLNYVTGKLRSESLFIIVIFSGRFNTFLTSSPTILATLLFLSIAMNNVGRFMLLMTTDT